MMQLHDAMADRTVILKCNIKVFDAVRRLESFPESGRIVPEIKQQNILEIILGNYRIIYRLKDDCAEILTVYHSARLLDNNSITEALS